MYNLWVFISVHTGSLKKLSTLPKLKNMILHHDPRKSAKAEITLAMPTPCHKTNTQDTRETLILPI